MDTIAGFDDILAPLNKAVVSAEEPEALVAAWFELLPLIRRDWLDFTAFSFFLCAAPPISTGSLAALHFYLYPLGSGKSFGSDPSVLDEDTAEYVAWRQQSPRTWHDEAEGRAYICQPLIASVVTVALQRAALPTDREVAVFGRLAQALEPLLRRYRDLSRLQALTVQIQKDSARIESLELTQQFNADLVALLDGSYDLFGADQEAVSQKVIRLIVDRLDFDRAGLFLIEPDAKHLRGAWGVDDQGDIIPIDTTLLPLDIQPIERLSEMALVALGEMDYFLTQDLDGEQAYSVEGDIKASGVVPMRVGDRIVGTLAVDNYFSGRPIGRKQLYSLMILANQGAAALANAAAYQEVQRSQKQYADLYSEAQTSRLRLKHLSKRLVEAQENERRHIARELHDEISQVLTGLNLTMAVMAELPEAALRQRLEKAQELVNELTAQVRNLSLELRPSMLDDQGLRPALLWQFKRYTERCGIEVDFKFDGSGRRFAPEIETAGYRIVQEALTNAARYADIGRIKVRLEASDSRQLIIEVTDQGRGFDLEQIPLEKQNGLSGMRERVDLLGGGLVLKTAPGQGTQIKVEIPLADPTASDGSKDEG
jgi:signal transduction histidine kinase